VTDRRIAIGQADTGNQASLLMKEKEHDNNA
jgi:hypothetical protein